MHRNKVFGLIVLLYCELCLTIKVPIAWNESANSAVKNDPNSQVEIIKPENVQTLHQSLPIPIEYFQYPARKPQFAADIAKFHGLQNPHLHYKAYPVKPYTNKEKPILGIHQILNEDKTIYQPFQNYVQKTEEIKTQLQPSETGFEIFHPYKAEEPALQEIYKDPVLTKIRNDLQESKNRLQTYENEASKPNITDDEYLEGQEKTDKKLFPYKNVPVRYEVHRPERRPVYYRAPIRDGHRDHVLNERFKHPWNQHNIKIRPVHYKPLRNHIHHLRHHHAMKYDDERNEYPQVPHYENIGEPLDGYDIYEKGKQKYTQLRNNVDESLNKVVQQNKPKRYENLELQKNEAEPVDEDSEFIPIKNYAQVRKTETFKHVPKNSAYDDAETYEEILNAPRLREAVKSTKAQTVYSEEGYEDSAYDHAGEQKHASDHEGHGGFLKEKEKSGGLYKTPTVLGSYQDGKGSESRDKTEHGEKWSNNNKDNAEENESEEFTEEEQEKDVGSDTYNDKGPEINNRNKREDEINTNSSEINITKSEDNNSDLAQDSVNKNLKNSSNTNLNYTNLEHEVGKRETNFKIPEINLNTTYLTEDEILKIANKKFINSNAHNAEKYPYYFGNLKAINKNSPLRYAENLKLIPKKSVGGTEFYDSRSILECPDVDEDIDPLPEKLKNGENPTEDENEETNNKGEEFDIVKKQPRLKGLGDKIDCFKAKYFGKNPLDSPFFKEDIIISPEPIFAPKLPIYKQLRKVPGSARTTFPDISKNIESFTNNDLFAVLNKYKTVEKPIQHINKSNNKTNLLLPEIFSTATTHINQQINVSSDKLSNINNNNSSHLKELPISFISPNTLNKNINYTFFQNKEEVTQQPIKLRKRRATPFIYEPYKIIKDTQTQDSKKTTTTSNISPLIRQLQSSRVIDRVSRSNRDDKLNTPNSNSRMYVDIGRKDRVRSSSNPKIVDVSIDQRRGEPRYEIRHPNHKSEYTPVENKKAVSVEDYKNIASPERSRELKPTDSDEQRTTSTQNGTPHRFVPATTVHPVLAITPSPEAERYQNVAASSSVRRTVTTTTPASVSKEVDDFKSDDSEESDEQYDNDDDYESNEDKQITTTTTLAPPKPLFRKRMRVVSTTEKIQQNDRDEPEKLKLITRFRNYDPEEPQGKVDDTTKATLVEEDVNDSDSDTPKYREKKKKTSKSTLLTDTKKYGNDDDDETDDLRRKEVDAMIGIKQDMDDYMPLYEKERNKEYESERDENDDEDDHDSDDDDSDYEDDDDDDDSDDDFEEDEDDDDGEYNEKNKTKYLTTTPEPTKRTLVRTTNAPSPTVASSVISTSPTPSRIRKQETKPIITRKKIEIHKELPVNKSLPHTTQFRQDIKEIEVIKEIPTTRRKRPQKKVEALELYKDDNLAKDVNKLDDVEIFNEAMDLDKGPRHGGNYKQATREDIKLLKPHETKKNNLKDAETSQSKNRQLTKPDEHSTRRMRGNDLKTRNKTADQSNDMPPSVKNRGNLKYNNQRLGTRKSEKLIELEDDGEEDSSSHEDDYKPSSNVRNDRLHGGNYRSAKLKEANVKENDDILIKKSGKETKRSPAAVLSSFVQAAPILTSTPGYIVDPSKRMYYYVDI